MKRDLAVKREKILRRISLEEYRGLLKFVEDVYLAEYALKVLLARKCSSLFFALLELAREEDGGRVRHLYQERFSDRDQPIVISDRAVDYFADDIKRGRFTRILVADDIIIHGTTIVQLYERLKSLIQEDECEIELRAYAVNKNNMIGRQCLENVKADRKCDAQELRMITDEVVDIFRLTGQPFTSYVPNIALKGKTQLRERVQDFAGKSREMADELYNPLFPHSYAWIDPHRRSYSMFQSVRFYPDDELEQCIIVPMVSLMPVKKDILFAYGEILKEFIYEDYYKKVLVECGDIYYKLMVYAISSLWCGLFFWEQFECPMPSEESYVEEANFGAAVLNQERLKALRAEDIKDILGRLESAYQKVDAEALMGLSSDFCSLQGKWNMAVQERPGGEVMLFLRTNGELEEEMWEKSQGNARVRLDGYPVCCILNWGEDGPDNNIVIQILTAIDFGYGSIIAKAYPKGDTVYYVALLHSGERNYKYTERRYFPFLYGLFEIEKAAGNARSKNRFMEEYINANSEMEKNRESLKKLCDLDVTREYKSVLIKDAWYYSDQKGLEDAINLADKIMEKNL